MEQVKRQNLSEIIAGRIKQFIVSNELKPGDRLPTEHEMAERFGVSRVSVREATKALGFLGVIRAAPRRGLTVGEFDLQRVTENLGFPMVLTEYPKRQLLRTRVVIETGGLPHVAERMIESPELYDQLTELNVSTREAKTLDAWIEADIAFHRALLDASDLGPLVAFGDLLQVFFNRFRRDTAHGDQEAGARGHQLIIDALRRGDVEEATASMRRHLKYYETCL
jgi:GntR family transcriptional regulator, transcriptional repressor for pyruvate dehydrogenase complex